MKKDKDQIGKLAGNVFKMTDLIDYQEGAIVSRTLVDSDTGTLTVFAFDKGQCLRPMS